MGRAGPRLNILVLHVHDPTTYSIRCQQHREYFAGVLGQRRWRTTRHRRYGRAGNRGAREVHHASFGRILDMRITGGGVRLSASDVANFLACQHLTRLDLLRARGELRPPHEFDIGFTDLAERGNAHERAVLDRFRADGHGVTVIGGHPDVAAAAATLEAIRSGADVIYQGVLVHDRSPDEPALLGRPDFLIRAGLLEAPDGEPRRGEPHYEVVDAKLARSARARAVAQTAFYSHLLAGAQLIRPRWMHLALGNGEFT